MNISDVRVRLITKEDSKLKAVASITIDNAIAIHDIKIVEGTEGCFVAMPSRKTGEGEYRDIAHPINAEARTQLLQVVLDAYKAELEKAE